MPQNEQIFKAILHHPWALHPAKLEEIALVLDRRLSGEKLELPEAAAIKGDQPRKRYEIQDGVAVLPVYGVLDKRMNLFMRFSGGTSTELLARDFKEALDDPQVQAILLDVDSPGGAVDGTKELADLVFAARGVKPVVAYANGLMASAAYWIGSAAQAVVAPETAEIGSIGVALLHYDFSAADEKAGVRRTFITGGKYKRIASDEKPLSEEGREYLQGMVDDYYGLFVEAVARNRGVEAEKVQEKMAEGRLFVGKKARKAGLIDQMGNFNDALALARAKGGAMPKNMTKATLQAGNPELFQEILAEGAAGVTLEALLAQQPETGEKLRAEGREAGIKAERDRAVKILAKLGLKGISLKLIEDGSGYEAALEAMLDHRDQVKAEALKALGSEAPPAVGSDPAKVETHVEDGEDSPIETRAKAEWDKNPKLHKEFRLFENYLGFKRAEENGKVKILKKS